MSGNSDPQMAKYLSLSNELGSMAGDKSLRGALADLVAMMHELDVRFALFGAFAVAAYVKERRSTMDVDIVAPQAGIDLIRLRAGDFGFTVTQGQDPESRMLVLMHRDGATIDVLNNQGFADLDHITTVALPGLGDIPVASAEDIVRAKLRTQLPIFKRPTEKRLIDRADLTALLREHPEVLDQVHRSLVSISPQMRSGADPLLQAIEEVCREAQLDLPNPKLAKAWKVWLVLVLFVVLAIGLLTVVVMVINALR